MQFFGWSQRSVSVCISVAVVCSDICFVKCHLGFFFVFFHLCVSFCLVIEKAEEKRRKEVNIWISCFALFWFLNTEKLGYLN